ncbi:myosin heavy chain-like protein [Rhynchospora pubera]|uniref:Myosin heavy chain-like protein n=1 Tax=Rhynchospora pubera TaxID=906938 RepID=A0AAV8HHG9_9POAL|nr:myosin heavy chain-like protein [Rhynchospora pubera]
MEERGKNADLEALILRVEQLQRERDELKKDIEQLCMQQAGPGYLSMATQMHSQRAANLEQDIESLQKRLASCLREKHNLQEELAEAHRIKSQLAELHNAELTKNKEADRQVKFFQNCVAAAFAERDQALMEREKVKEREEPLNKKLAELEERIEELQSSCLHEKRSKEKLEVELKDLKIQIEPFEKVVEKFYGIRDRDLISSSDTTTEEKCQCLLRDSPDNWIYAEDGETSTMKYIASLEEEKDALKNSIDKLQNNLRMGLDIEHHLRRNVRSLEKKQKLYDKLVNDKLKVLREFCNHVRFEISRKLEQEESHIKDDFSGILEKLSQIKIEPQCDAKTSEEPLDDENDDIEYKDVHISADVINDTAQSSNPPTNISNDNIEMSKALAQALQEKVATLLLLSQQEERHLLERNMNEALLKKIEELQKNLSQVTNEKVKALMELAKLKQDIQLLQQDSGNNPRHGGQASNDLAIVKRNKIQEEGKLKNIIKKTYLRRWISNAQDDAGTDAKEYSVNLARLKIENATFHESIANMERLTSSIHRLHVSLMKVQEDLKSEAGPSENTYEALSSVITESNLMKTALGSVLPISWSGDSADVAITYESLYESSDPSEASRSEKADPLSSAGLEMVELLLLAAETLTERLIDRNASI